MDVNKFIILGKCKYKSHMICVTLLFRLLLRCCSVHVAVLQSLHTPVCVERVVKMSTSATSVGKSILEYLNITCEGFTCNYNSYCVGLLIMMNVILSCATLVDTANMQSLRQLCLARVVLQLIL